MQRTRILVYGTMLYAMCSILIGCAYTQIASQVNREIGPQQYKKMLVMSTFGDLEWDRQAEYSLCAEINRRTICKAIACCDVFFVGRNYSEEEFYQRINELCIDAFLSVEPAGIGTTSTYIPPITRTQSQSSGSAHIFGNSIYGSSTGSSTTRTYGGYNVSKPWMNCIISLSNIESGEVNWYATAKSRGNAFADWRLLSAVASREIAKTLIADGILARRY